MTHEEYRRLEGINCSSLKVLIQKSPKHFQWDQAHPREETDALAFGTAFHMAILEPLRFIESYVVKPVDMSFATKEGKAWKADHAGDSILTSREYDSILAMRDSVMTHPAAGALLSVGGDVERPILWTNEQTGEKCKGRPDLVTPAGDLIDLKSVKSIVKREFEAEAARYGWYIAMAFYADGLAANDRPPRRRLFIACEKTAPFDCVVYELPEDVIDQGRYEYENGLIRLAECRKLDRWPGMSDGIVQFDLPKWAVPYDLEDEEASYTEVPNE